MHEYSIDHVDGKRDEGKLRWDLLPVKPIEDLVKILTYGASKYGAHTWKTVPRGKERYFAALMRHLVAWRKGELVDEESGLSHLAHAMCNLMFISEFEDADC
jgi:hypothetical protein